MTEPSIILGCHTPERFLAMLAFLLLGAVLRKLYKLRKRKPLSPHSPKNLSLTYWLRDNGYDMLIGLILAYLVVRFPVVSIEPLAALWFPNLPTQDMLLLGSVLVGLGIDLAAERLSKFTNLKT